MKKVKETTDHVDILFANAGATWGEKFDTHPDSAFAKVMDLNVKSVFNTIRLYVMSITHIAAFWGTASFGALDLGCSHTRLLINLQIRTPPPKKFNDRRSIPSHRHCLHRRSWRRITRRERNIRLLRLKRYPPPPLLFHASSNPVSLSNSCRNPPDPQPSSRAWSPPYPLQQYCTRLLSLEDGIRIDGPRGWRREVGSAEPEWKTR